MDLNTNLKTQKDVLLQVKNLKKYFPIRNGLFSKVTGNVKAVDDVSFEIIKGETLGLVGESGCGKTTVGRTLLRLLEPTSGSIFYKGEDISNYSRSQLRPLRPKMQIIFQDPYSSLNPRMTVGNMLSEAIRVHNIVPNHEVEKEVHRLLDVVGLPKAHSIRYPHEFSGGQRQRIGIARALSVKPELIVCDEAVSALDVSIQAQVINLLKDLQQEYDLTYLFIAHDLSVVEYISDRVAVMYLGKIVEIADSEKIYLNTLHPYTKALMSAVPIPDPDKKSDRIVLTGDVPSPANPPTGCTFHPRCPLANKEGKLINQCQLEEPTLNEKEPSHFASCHQI
jgi:oligopeptide/dipeptide ABC transporter ATP-binding protein